MREKIVSFYAKALVGVLIAFTVIACTGDPARMNVRAVTVRLDQTDSSYVLIDGRKEVLLGFDLTADPTASKRPNIVEEIARHGGNLLEVDSTLYSEGEWMRLRAIAGEKGVVINGDDLPVQVRRIGTPQAFSAWVLGGAAAVAFTSFNQRNLNAIRAVRVVEQRLKMHELKLNSAILAPGQDGEAIGADDGRQNYAIYTPSTGSVNIMLDEGQFARKITVVGHLGTQRSEILYPPYDRSFTVLSNDAQGGWLIIKRLEEGGR